MKSTTCILLTNEQLTRVRIQENVLKKVIHLIQYPSSESINGSCVQTLPHRLCRSTEDHGQNWRINFYLNKKNRPLYRWIFTLTLKVEGNEDPYRYTDSRLSIRTLPSGIYLTSTGITEKDRRTTDLLLSLSTSRPEVEPDTPPSPQILLPWMSYTGHMDYYCQQ